MLNDREQEQVCMKQQQRQAVNAGFILSRTLRDLKANIVELAQQLCACCRYDCLVANQGEQQGLVESFQLQEAAADAERQRLHWEESLTHSQVAAHLDAGTAALAARCRAPAAVFQMLMSVLLLL